MSNFTEAQLLELEKLYGLTRIGETACVRDGRITKGDKVWWRCEEGPQLIDSNTPAHWRNIQAFPAAYQINQPLVDTVLYKE